MDWLLKNLVQLATVVFVIVSIVRAIRQSRNAQERHEDETVDSDEQRRTREIQEAIRRKIAERRGGSMPPATGPDVFQRTEEPSRPVRPSPEASPLPSGPLGDFGRRVLDQLERKTPPPAPPRLPEMVNRREVERQEMLAEQLRAAEDAKLDAARRAAHRAAEQRAALETDAALRAVARKQLLNELRDPQSLRRAFVLREVLGPPVGLR